MKPEPLSRMPSMKAMTARHAESQETRHRILIQTLARRRRRHHTTRRRVRHAQPHHADAAARQMAATLETDGAGSSATASEGMAVGRMDAVAGGGVDFVRLAARQRSFAVGATEGDLAGWRSERDATGGGAGEFGGLDVEADAGVGQVPGLHGVAVGFSPARVALAGEVAGDGEGHCEGGGLDVVGFDDVVLE